MRLESFDFVEDGEDDIHHLLIISSNVWIPTGYNFNAAIFRNVYVFDICGKVTKKYSQRQRIAHKFSEEPNPELFLGNKDVKKLGLSNNYPYLCTHNHN